MSGNGFAGVLGATGIKATLVSDQATQSELIAGNQVVEQGLYHWLERVRNFSAREGTCAASPAIGFVMLP